MASWSKCLRKFGAENGVSGIWEFGVWGLGLPQQDPNSNSDPKRHPKPTSLGVWGVLGLGCRSVGGFRECWKVLAWSLVERLHGDA